MDKTITNEIEEIPDWLKSGATGAAAALFLAMFIPAKVLLGAEAVVSAGVYLYRRSKLKSMKKPASETTVDVTPEEEKKEN